MRIGSAFPSDYLKVDDLQGRPLTVTITNVSQENVGNNDYKPVVHFREVQQGLVLNKTNANRIVDALGTDETDHWTGRQITLVPDKTEFQGKIVPCVRVMLQQPQWGGQPNGTPQPTPQQMGNAMQAPLEPPRQAPGAPMPGYEVGDPLNYQA